MKGMKRILALLLALVMVIQVVPVYAANNQNVSYSNITATQHTRTVQNDGKVPRSYEEKHDFKNGKCKCGATIEAQNCTKHIIHDPITGNDFYDWHELGGPKGTGSCICGVSFSQLQYQVNNDVFFELHDIEYVNNVNDSKRHFITCKNHCEYYPGAYQPNYKDELHEYSEELTVTLEPTCSQIGKGYKVCTKCGAQEYEDIDKIPHTASSYVQLNNYEPKDMYDRSSWEQDKYYYGNDNRHYLICSVCGGHEVQAHDLEWTVVTPATCENDGQKVGVCKYCGYQKTETIKHEGHKNVCRYSDEQYHIIVCSVCGKVNSTEAHKKSSLSMGNNKCICGVTITKRENTYVHKHQNVNVVKVEATCTEDGHEAGTRCKECGKTQGQEVIKATGHSYGDWEVETLASCTVDGKMIRTCSKCEHEDEQVILASHDLVPVAKVEATCTTPGHEPGFRCKYCRYTEGLGEIRALGHDFENGTLVESVPSTCKVNGHTTVRCSRCNEEDTQELDLDENNHSAVTVNGYDSTCYSEGLTDGTICEWCEDILEAQETIAKKQHHLVEDPYALVEYQNVGDEHIRSYILMCDNDGCSYYESASINLPHNLQEVEGSRHYVNNGDNHNQTWIMKCSDCGNENIEYSAYENHTYGDWSVSVPATCTTAGEKVRYCSLCEHEDKDVTGALEHAWDNGEITTEPTCQEGGVKTFHCTRTGCNETKTEPVVALGHEIRHDAEIPATCTEKGYTAGEYCTRCNEYISGHEEIGALQHAWDNGEITIEPTCQEEGERTFHCTRTGCNGTKTEVEPANPDNHTVVIDMAKVATCTEGGKTLGKHCSECGAILLEQEDTLPLDHAWDEGTVTVEPTCTEEGNMHYECNACQATKDEPIEKLPHNWIVREIKDIPKGLQYYNGEKYSHDHQVFYKCEDCSVNRSQYTNGIQECTPGEIVIENIIPGTAEKVGTHDEVKYCTECKQEVYRQTVEDKIETNVLEQITKETFEKTFDGNDKVLFDGEDSKIITLVDEKENVTKVKVTGTYDNNLPGDRKINLTIEVIEGNMNPSTYEVKDIEGKINVIEFTDEFDYIQLPKNMVDKKQIASELLSQKGPFDKELKELTFEGLEIKEAKYTIADLVSYGIKHEVQIVVEATIKDTVVARKTVKGNVIYNKSNKNKNKDKGVKDDTVITLDDENTALGLDIEFTDLKKDEVTPSDWAKADVYSLVGAGIINGYEDMTYRPNNKIRRDEFSKLSYLVLDLKENKYVKAIEFKDVIGNWAEEMIKIATTNEVLKGYDEETFGPSDNITNEQMMSILVRGLKTLGINVKVEKDSEANEELAKVIDGDKVSDWAKNDAATAIKYGLFVGDENKALNPQGNTTRAQVAVILNRYIKLINELKK